MAPRPLARSAVLAALALLLAALPWERPTFGQVPEPAPPVGRVLAASRGQVAWLNWDVPRPQTVAAFPRPAYVTDVAASPDWHVAVATVVAPLHGEDGWGGDLHFVDLLSGQTNLLVRRADAGETYRAPVWLPGAGGILFERGRGVVPAADGQAPVATETVVELADWDGTGRRTLVADAASPGPTPDGAGVGFVRQTAAGPALLQASLATGAERVLVPAGPFLAIDWPRYAPDGARLAFVAVSALAAPVAASLPAWPLGRVAHAHGLPWEVWMVNADGSGLQRVPDLIADDASLAWSPDGAQLFVYSSWGGYLAEPGRGGSAYLPYLAGIGGMSWLPPGAPGVP